MDKEFSATKDALVLEEKNKKLKSGLKRSLFSIKEAAECLGMRTPQTLYRWVKRGAVPSVPWGGRGIRITSEVIDELNKNGLRINSEFNLYGIGKSRIVTRSRLNGGRAWR